MLPVVNLKGHRSTEAEPIQQGTDQKGKPLLGIWVYGSVFRSVCLNEDSRLGGHIPGNPLTPSLQS